MTKKDKLIFFKKILSKLNYDNRITKTVYKDLEVLEEEDLIYLYDDDMSEYSKIKNVSGAVSLSTELYYIYYLINNYINNHVLSINEDSITIVSFIIFAGLVLHAYAESEIQRADDKLTKLEMIMKNDKKIN